MDRTTEIVCDFDSENSYGAKEALPAILQFSSGRRRRAPAEVEDQSA